MTTPIVSGYPDFGRYQAQATKLYAKASLTNQNTNVTVNLGYVGDVSNIAVVMRMTANSARISMDFTMDSAGTINVGNHTIGLRVGDIFTRTVPVLGPYCIVTIIIPTAGTGIDYSFVQAASPYASMYNSSTSNVILSGYNVSCPAGATFVDGNVVAPGPASFFAKMPAANTFMDLFTVDEITAVKTFLCRVDLNDGNKVQPLYLPAQHVQLTIQNNTAGALLFLYSLTTDVGLR